MQHYLAIRGHLYFELTAQEVYRYMKLGTSLSMNWMMTQDGMKKYQIITDCFQNYFHEKVYLTTEKIELQDMEDVIELSVCVNLQVAINPDQVEDDIVKTVERLFLGAYNTYNDVSEQAATTYFYDAQLITVL